MSGKPYCVRFDRFNQRTVKIINRPLLTVLPIFLHTHLTFLEHLFHCRVVLASENLLVYLSLSHPLLQILLGRLLILIIFLTIKFSRIQRHQTQSLPKLIRQQILVTTPDRRLILFTLTSKFPITPKFTTPFPNFTSSPFPLHFLIFRHPSFNIIRSMFCTSKNSIRYLLCLSTTKIQQFLLLRW